MEAQEQAELAEIIRKVKPSRLERRRSIMIAISLVTSAILCIVMLFFAFSYKADLTRTQKELDSTKQELEQCRNPQ